MPIRFNKMPSQEYLKECLDYDPFTGIFTWKERPLHHFKWFGTQRSMNTQFTGKKAGFIRGDSGYLMIGIDGTSYRAHRIAWKIMTGNDPKEEIDHIDTVRSNCSFENLREASGFENIRNRGEHKNNKLGLKGVSFIANDGIYKAEIMKNRKKYLLGRFSDPNDAHEAYKKACKKLHGDFSRAMK